MFKIHLTNNKETLIAAGINICLVILFIVNIVVLTPLVLNIFKGIESVKNRDLIDAKTVNQAIEELNKLDL